MRKLTSLAVAGMLIFAAPIAQADGHVTEPLAPPLVTDDVWESEAARSSSINATYVVTGILLAFLLVNAVND